MGESDDVLIQFTSLGVEPHIVEKLFMICEGNGDGFVGLEEFVNGVNRVRQGVQAVDLFALEVQQQTLHKRQLATDEKIDTLVHSVAEIKSLLVALSKNEIKGGGTRDETHIG
eukprot:GDKI01040364.1.p1 GENE.GDKI01040364.1~~GDKI01040364.1.p1  ORF type:complete len:126 (+),score=22.41 GDKI01040364.1:41-379(+)